jgi:hypothetical protein
MRSAGLTLTIAAPAGASAGYFARVATAPMGESGNFLGEISCDVVPKMTSYIGAIDAPLPRMMIA